MQDNYFDKKMKAALDNIEPAYDPKTWDMLAAKMDALANPAPVDEVDKVVARGLQTLEPRFQPAHWDMLAVRMDSATELRRRLVGSKVLEAILLLLLALNLAGILGGERKSLAPPKPKYKGPVAEAETTPLNRSKTKNARANPTAVFAETPSAIAVSDIFGNADTPIFSTENPNSTQIPTDPAATPVFAKNIENQTFADILPFAALPGLTPEELEKSNAANPAFASLVVKKRSEKHYYVSNYASTARNHIRTPYDENLKKDGYEQWAGGYGAGVAFGVRKGKWGVETGVAYSSKTYRPSRPGVEVYAGNALSGFRGSKLTEVDLDVASVPVSVDRRIARAGKTTVRARAGATANFALQSAYRYEDIKLPPTQPNPTEPPPPVNGTPRFSKKGKGLLEGGSFSENTWATAEAALRIERPVSQRFTAFVETVFSRPIAGTVGPKNAKISSVGLNAGVMATL